MNENSAIALASLVLFTACNQQPVDRQGGQYAQVQDSVSSEGIPDTAFSGTPVANQNGDSANTYRVMDATALGRPAVALEVMLPAGWRGESSVRWDNINGQCSLGIASPMFRLTSADNKTALEQFPGFLVSTSEQSIRSRGSQPGDFCQYGTATSGEEFARQTAIPFLRPQSQITSVRSVDLDPPILVQSQRIQQAGGGSGMRVIPYQVEVLLANKDGTNEKITLGGIILAGQQMMPGVPPLILNQNMVGYAVRAIPEKMAETEALAARVRASIRPGPEWTAAVQEMGNKLTKPVFRDNGPSPTPGGTYSGGSTSGSSTGGYATGPGNEGLNSDGAQRQRIDSIREEERCSDGRVVSIHVGC